MVNLFLTSQYFSIFGIKVSYYGLIMACAMLAGVLCAYFICKKKDYSLSMPINLALYALPLAIIGARLYYCALNGVDNFVDIFKVWEGGMAIYGGVIGGFIGVLICCKIHKYSLLKACDIAAPCLILGQAIGRFGCYFAGCCYGVETTNELLQVFPLSVLIDGEWHLATFFYEAFFNFIGFLLLILLVLRTEKNGTVTAGYLIIYGTTRGILEQFRDPRESLMLFNSGIKASQLLSIVLIIVGTIMLFILLRKNKSQV